MSVNAPYTQRSPRGLTIAQPQREKTIILESVVAHTAKSSISWYRRRISAMEQYKTRPSSSIYSPAPKHPIYLPYKHTALSTPNGLLHYHLLHLLRWPLCRDPHQHRRRLGPDQRWLLRGRLNVLHSLFTQAAITL